MSRLLSVIENCPKDVQDYVRQTVLVNEHVRIIREIEGFKSLAFSYGCIDLSEACENALKTFSASIDFLDHEAG